MSKVIETLRNSVDPLHNDLAQVYDHWQEVKRSQGQRAGLGYEPRDINALGPETVISRRVLNAAAGFEEVDSDKSYEALVLKYPERFSDEVITAAQRRLRLGASKIGEFLQQEIQFFVKSSSIDLFGEKGVKKSIGDWVGRDATLPELRKEYDYADKALAKRFRAIIWLHEQEKDGERGSGLTAMVEFSPIQEGRNARILDVMFFERPVGKEFLDAHKEDGSFVSKIDADRRNWAWPIPDRDVDTFLSAVREKVHKISRFEKLDPDPRDPPNLEKIEDLTALRKVVLRRYQAAFRQALLRERPNCCALTGTSEISVLDAAHIIPYATKFADRDKLENGLLLRSDIHKLFDAHQITINPATKTVVISEHISSSDYLKLHGARVTDRVSEKSLSFHFKEFQRKHWQ